MNHDPISRATVDAGAEAANRVGTLLRASRLRCGEELDDVANVLRIRRRHLEAIEDGRFGELPGAAYAVGFIRAYADHLGLDSDEVVRRFKAEVGEGGAATKAELVFPTPMAEGGVPKGAVVFLGVLIGLIAYGGWYVSTVDNDFFKRWVAPIPERLAGLLPSDEPNADGGPSTPSATEAVAADPGRPSAMAGETPVAQSAETQPVDAAPAVQPSTEAVETPSPTDAAVAAPAPADQPSVAQDQPAPTTAADQGQAATPAAETPPHAADPASTVAEAASDSTSGTTEGATAEGATTIAADETPVAASAETETETAAPATNAVETGAVKTGIEVAALPAPDQATAGQSSEGATDGDAAATTSSDEATAGPAVADPALANARIVVKATDDSWVEIRELGTDQWIWGKLLRAGQVYAVPDRPDLKLKTGNAGGLEIVVDGTAVPSLGDSGEVVRNVLLDPERLKAGQAIVR